MSILTSNTVGELEHTTKTRTAQSQSNSVTAGTENCSYYLLANCDKKVYLSRELSKEEQLLENDLLKKRRECIDSGIPRNKVKVQNLKLLHYDDQSNTWDEAALDTGW